MRKSVFVLVLCSAVAALVLHAPSRASAQDKNAKADFQDVLKAQAKRAAVVKKITPAVVAVFSRGGKGGGSGVLISKDGYALTNYHVVAPTGAVMQCGLADGNLYDAVLVGWDKVGDVALIKLLPQKPGQDFKFAPMGDSDKVRAGDWSLAAGNPFLLATDFTPTVTFGMISGVHRYQYPSGTILEYTDCIQIDTSINPGNSGGPLFNMDGELIGINGRGSFDKRGRVNSGVGYAISINQIKNFMGHLKAGLDCDHASLGAIVTTQTEASGLGRLLITNMLDDSDVARRGLDFDDEIVSFDGRLITSANQYRNILGLYPRGWRVPMEYRRGSKTKNMLVRLMGIQRRVLSDPNPQKPKGPKINPGPTTKSPASKYYVKKEGFINYYFNKQEKDRVLSTFKKKQGDFSDFKGTWKLKGKIRLRKLNTPANFTMTLSPEMDKGQDAKVTMVVDEFPYELAPIKDKTQPAGELRQPAGSGGFLAAMYLYKKLLIQGEKAFIKCSHAGSMPIYPPPAKGKEATSLTEQKVVGEVLRANLSRYLVDWYFSPQDNKELLGFEMRIDEENQDPCEVYLSDYRPVQGRLMPHNIQVRYGDGTYGRIELTNIELSKS